MTTVGHRQGFQALRSMEPAARSGCDSHHVLNASFPHLGDNPGACGNEAAAAALMLNIKANPRTAATSARPIVPSHSLMAQVLSINSKLGHRPCLPSGRDDV